MLRKQTQPPINHHCPVCGFHGEFTVHMNQYRPRIRSMCPICGSIERTRLLKLVLNELALVEPLSEMSCVHFSPGSGELHPKMFKSLDVYGTLDTPFVDLANTGFANNEYDFLIASHVLEHIRDDEKALKEITRVTKKIAILPVPAYREDTIEYLAPNNEEHMRDTGLDYYDKYTDYFSVVVVMHSKDFPSSHQTCLMIDKTNGRGELCTPILEDGIYEETIPVCFV